MFHARTIAIVLALSSTAISTQTAAAETPAKPLQKSMQRAVKNLKPGNVLPVADQAQLDAAERTHFGPYDCDFKQTIDVGMNPKTPGYVDVKFKDKTYTMKPISSSTGALRLEDVTGRTLLIQIADKSMLMDVKIGQRLVDNCMHEKHRAFVAANK
jgi:hypothetical protein